MKLSIKKIPKKVFIALFLTFLLGVSVARASIPGTIYTLSPGPYPGAPHYTVWTEDGVTYFLKDQTGLLTSSTALAAMLNTYLALLTGGGSLLFASSLYDYIAESTIIVSRGYVTIEAESISVRLKLGSNVNEDLIQIPYGSDEVTIRNIQLDGNNDANTAGNVIYANNTNLRLHNCRVTNASESNVKLYNPGAPAYAGLHWIVGNSIIWADMSGIVLYGVYDCFIYANDIGDNAASNIYALGAASSEIHDNQIWGSHQNGISFFGCVGMSINDNRIDYNYHHGISLGSENDTLVSNNKIYLNGQNAFNTYAGIYVLDWYTPGGPRIYVSAYLTITDNDFHFADNQQRRGIEADVNSGNGLHWTILGNNVNGNLSSPSMYIGNLTDSTVDHNEGYP